MFIHYFYKYLNHLTEGYVLLLASYFNYLFITARCLYQPLMGSVTFRRFRLACWLAFHNECII